MVNTGYRVNFGRSTRVYYRRGTHASITGVDRGLLTKAQNGPSLPMWYFGRILSLSVLTTIAVERVANSN